VEGYKKFDASWSKIAKCLKGRTENSVKNRFYSTVRKFIGNLEKHNQVASPSPPNAIKPGFDETLENL